MTLFVNTLLALVDGGDAAQGAVQAPLPQTTMDLSVRLAFVSVFLVPAWPLVSMGARAMLSKASSDIPAPAVAFGSLGGVLLMAVSGWIALRGLPAEDRQTVIIWVACFSIISIILTIMHYYHLSKVKKSAPGISSICQYLPNTGATAAGMDDIIRSATFRLDLLLVAGDKMATMWHDALLHAAQNASAKGLIVRVILMKPDKILCDLGEIISGTQSSRLQQQIIHTRQLFDAIKSKCSGIDIRFLARLPPCSMWLADSGTVKRVNIETLFCTDNGDGPVFRCTDQSLFAKCAKEFDTLWAQAQ